MIRLLSYIVIGFLFSIASNAFGEGPYITQKKPVVYCIPVSGEINPKMSSYFSKCMKDAKSKRADLIIIKMDSYGGYLTSCDEMRILILRSKIPVWTFVDYKAVSAGAMITICSQDIYMTEDALIGASTVVVDKKPLYDKFQSLARARMRNAAVINCRNPDVAENMVGYYDTISKQERVLSLTADEAIILGYCEGIYSDLTSLVDQELPGSILLHPPEELLELAMSSQSDVEFVEQEEPGDNEIKVVLYAILGKLWIVALVLMYGTYSRAKAENKTLKEILRNKDT